MCITNKVLKTMKVLREKRGLSMQDVADGIDYKTGKGYFDLESGKTKIKLEHLEKLAKFYKVPISIFFDKDITKMVI